jgi:hypothetical protein
MRTFVEMLAADDIAGRIASRIVGYPTGELIDRINENKIFYLNCLQSTMPRIWNFAERVCEYHDVVLNTLDIGFLNSTEQIGDSNALVNSLQYKRNLIASVEF